PSSAGSICFCRCPDQNAPYVCSRAAEGDPRPGDSAREVAVRPVPQERRDGNGRRLRSGNKGSTEPCRRTVTKKDEFRLRPHRPPKSGKNETIAWATALKTVFRYASTSARRCAGCQSTRSAGKPRKQFNQRCAAR